MPQLLIRRKLSIKPIPIVREPSAGYPVEFRWSISAAKVALSEESLLPIVPFLNLDRSHKKSSFFSPSLSGQISLSQLSMSSQKMSPSSPRLPNIYDMNKKRKLSLSPAEDNNVRMSPLLLTYSQLHHPQRLSQTRKTIQKCFSIYSSSNDFQSSTSDLKTNVSSSSESTSLSNDKYIRLRTAQLQRLHVSEKYMKEAKTLYYNASSKSFVPRQLKKQVS